MTETENKKESIINNGSKIGTEISITGKWVPKKSGFLFMKSNDSKELINEWNEIHAAASEFEGILSTEVNSAIGEDAVLIHHVFDNKNSLLKYFNSIAREHVNKLTQIASPEVQIIRGVEIDEDIEKSIPNNIKIDYAEYRSGYIRNDYAAPDKTNAINVTAKWKVHPNSDGTIDELIYWWEKVATEAYDLEKGLSRFEIYKVKDEDALVIHEVFDTNEQLQFHLSKGTAAIYKKEIDKVAAPENYFFRGPVSWMIRTYSKFMNLPATYSRNSLDYKIESGSFSDGLNKRINF